MRVLLLCAVVAVCVSGTLGARRRLLVGGPGGPGPRRPFQPPRPFGGRPNFRQGERPEFRDGPVPGRVPPQQLRLAPQERFPSPPLPLSGNSVDQQFQGPFRAEPPQPFRQQTREPFPSEPFGQEPQDSFRQDPQDSFRQEPQDSFRPEPQAPFRQESDAPFRQDPEDSFRRESFRPESLEPFGREPFGQKSDVAEERPAPVKISDVAEERQELTAEPTEFKRPDFAPLNEQAASFSEPEPAADSRQDDYSLNIPEKQEKQRLEFQVHGQQGPHSYRFGYDTGSGYNRQFRFEERDADGNLKGRYGYYKDGKLQVVNYSATHEGGFHAEGDFGKFPESSH